MVPVHIELGLHAQITKVPQSIPPRSCLLPPNPRIFQNLIANRLVLVLYQILDALIVVIPVLDKIPVPGGNPLPAPMTIISSLVLSP
jgi:hypothetical protein